MSSLKAYSSEISKVYESSLATEHSYRPAFQTLLENLNSRLQVVNEPNRVKCGAPDFVVLQNSIPLGYVECKDLNKPLDRVQESEQLLRYRDSLQNLILTDYLDFRWFAKGELELEARLGSVSRGKISRNTAGAETIRLMREVDEVTRAHFGWD